jgi:hypothetical protein
MRQQRDRVEDFGFGARRRPDHAEPNRIAGQQIGGDGAKHGIDRRSVRQDQPAFKDLQCLFNSAWRILRCWLLNGLEFVI